MIALSSARDSYLYVLNGHGAAGTLRAQNDDADSNTRDSRIETRLDSGAYTIEAITRQARTRGSFTLTVTTSTPTPTPTPVTPIVVTFSGLSKRYTASVGNPVRVAFSYQPATAQMSLQQPTLAGLTLTASHPTCPTDANNPFDPLNPTHPWLPFTTDECSIPQKLIQGVEIWINAMILLHRPQLSLSQLINFRQYFRNNATFGTQTVPFVYACMRHDFNWRNLYRTEHHLKHGDTWNTSVRNEADQRFYNDLRQLCDVDQGSQPVTDQLYTWKLTQDNYEKCISVAHALKFGVQRWPIILTKDDNTKV